MRRTGRRIWSQCLLLYTLGTSGSPATPTAFKLSAASAAIPTADLKRLNITIRPLTAGRSTVHVSADRLKFAGHRFANLRAHCLSARLQAHSWECRRILISANNADTGPLHVSVRRILSEQTNAPVQAIKVVGLRLSEPIPVFQRLLKLPDLHMDLLTPEIDIQYRAGVWQVASPIALSAWGGRFEIRGVRFESDTTGRFETRANVYVERVDLKQLSGAYAFGQIQGRLSGKVENMIWSGPRAQQFDAVFMTPEDDDLAHTISQLAVDNITSLSGGGPVNALSRGLISVFQEFSYDKLGIKCRLRQGICHMDGIDTTPNGYVIVRHGLLPPWIDVLGYNREVNWNELLDRLRAAVASSGPAVQ